MRTVDADIDDVLEDVASVLLSRVTGASEAFHCEVRQTEDVVYLTPGVWQNISESLLSVRQSLDTHDAGAPIEELSIPGRVPRAFKEALKRIIQRSVYWYVNPVVAQLHRMHGATSRALDEIADELKRLSDRVERMEAERQKLGSILPESKEEGPNEKGSACDPGPPH